MMLPSALPITYTTTPGGLLLVLAVVLPAVAMLASLVLGARAAVRVTGVVSAAVLAVAIAIAVRIAQTGDALVYVLGGWQPPLGLALRADGTSAAMLVIAASIMCATGLYAHWQLTQPPAAADDRMPTVFRILTMAVWSALNAVFIGQDLFNLYVALELLTFGAVPLVCLDGRAGTVAAALRYLMFALLGSLLYLLGVGLIYSTYGVLDLRLLSGMVDDNPALSIALAAMIAGLLAKSALFPLHLWLPPAHSGAPPAASAILSALVVKAPFFLILRLLFELAPPVSAEVAGEILATLGALSILFCSIMAVRQERLKLMIAYSTAAQIGYLFLMFPLAAAGSEALAPSATLAWTGGMLQLASHALAKAAMFLAAGVIAEAFGHDRIRELTGFARVLPVSAFAFALGGLSLMGLPPSGGFTAKCLLITAAIIEGYWWIALTISAGGVIAAGYVFRVISRAFATPAAPPVPRKPVSRKLERIALALALGAVALGVLPLQPFTYLQIGHAAVAMKVVP
jgi:formate hydrogenlyase subunit 3/multisubunit Na+/H+ antiporter MnhD subunit